MPLNDLARRKLRELRRGDTLPYRTMISIVLCLKCKVANRYPRKKCRQCGEKLTPKPPRTCRLCEEPVGKGRYTWCGEECFNAYSLLTDASYLRGKVYDRDRGVCAACGIDCEELGKRLRAMDPAARREARVVLRNAGFNCSDYHVDSFWEAHHIVGMDEGGSWELSNIQTLCQPDHKEKTAEQAARRAKQGKLLGIKWKETQKQWHSL